MTVTLKKVGGSVAVLIPKLVAKELGLAEGTALELSTTADTLVMRKRSRRPRRPIAEIAARMRRADYRKRSREFAQDVPVGREVW